MHIICSSFSSRLYLLLILVASLLHTKDKQHMKFRYMAYIYMNYIMHVFLSKTNRLPFQTDGLMGIGRLILKVKQPWYQPMFMMGPAPYTCKDDLKKMEMNLSCMLWNAQYLTLYFLCQICPNIGLPSPTGYCCLTIYYTSVANDSIQHLRMTGCNRSEQEW